MKTTFIAGLMLVAFGNDITAMEPNSGSEDAVCLQEPEWNQDMEKVGELIENKIRYFLIDQNGNRININTKNDEEIRNLAHLMADVAQEQRYDPRHYDSPVWIGLATAIPQEKLWEFLDVRGKGILIETILDEVAQIERRRYGLE